ncbi:hypothetical protein BDF14DRAFT_1392123 [Spinellus fusiger]|nr:hypothetical protein BDF14DRAFT_1392123 [Spinellus fusiger]
MQDIQTHNESGAKKTIPQSVLDDDSQHTMHYSQCLPYANQLDGEAQEWLDTICTHLVISIKAQDYQSGAAMWTKRLKSYLDMKHALPRHTRAQLAKIMFELVVAHASRLTGLIFALESTI